MSERDSNTEWVYINLWDHHYRTESDNGVCFAMPEGTKYEDYEFWVPINFVKCDRKLDDALYFAVPEDFVFHLKKQEKNDKGRYVVVDELELNTEQLTEEFDKDIREIADKHNEERENKTFDRKKFLKKQEKLSGRKTDSSSTRAKSSSSADKKAMPPEPEEDSFSFERTDDDDDDSLDFEG